MNELTVGSLFAGIGGFDLGFERTGHMRTVWFCEQDPYCQRVLAKHWPGVPCYPDVRALVADTDGRRLEVGSELNGRETQDAADRDTCWEHADGRDDASGRGLVPVPVPPVDVLCGGFPCQDLSYAGRGAGIQGERSGLWREFARLIGELRPRYVVVENVPALAARGLDRVLSDLAACGFDAEWDHIPASAVGAPHRRDRLWLVAYPGGATSVGALQGVADTDDGGRSRRAGELGPGRRREPTDGGWWAVEPGVRRVAHGIPNRVDRLAALGNSLVPQIAEWIGWRIVELGRRRAPELGSRARVGHNQG